jgi:glycosyltransferase involved in cell wall biosynthesis
VLAPLPPNIEGPAEGADSLLNQRLAAARAEGRVIIGHFGSIYPAKRPNALLGICAILKQRGVKLLAVYIGSFIRAVDDVEVDFYNRVAALDLSEEVLVSGYVESDREVFGLFDQVDVFCYPLDEGLTARRSSVLASVQSGRPVIVSGPADAHEFDHHPRFQSLIEHGAVVLVPRGSDDGVYADRIIAVLKQSTACPPFDFAGWWRDTANAVKARL